MSKRFVIRNVVFVLCLMLLLPVAGYAAEDKLIVKNSGGTNVFTVNNSGDVTVMGNSGFGGSALTTYKLNAYTVFDVNNDTTSRGILNLYGVRTQTKTSGSDYGFNSVLRLSGTANGTLMTGTSYQIQQGSTGTLVQANALKAKIFFVSGIAGSIGDAHGMQVDMDAVDGSITNAYGIKINSFMVGTGHIGTAYGIYIGNQNAATTNYPIYHASGARLTNGGVWTDASSRALKENIVDLSTGQALDALQGLNPVLFNYKADKKEKYAGFIAEDVPDLVATDDRKGLSPMDIVAVLTKVVKDQQEVINELSAKVSQLDREMKMKGAVALTDINFNK